MRRCSLLLSLVVVWGCGAATSEPSEDHEDESNTEQAYGVMAILAGVSGRVNTLAYYSDGGRHPGNNSVDIGAPGGTSVWHQMDYLSPDIAGGEVTVTEAHEAGYCSQWYPGSEYYNGAKIYVRTDFYDRYGTWVRSHTAAFQHVDPYAPNMDATWTWNNAGSDAPRYPDGAHLTYGNGNAETGGLFLGTLTYVDGPIRNGAGGGLCTDGPHLHQEGEGSVASQRRVGETVSERYSDIHYF
jgi:hypothetical protein